MSETWLMGLDLGSSGVRCLLVNVNSKTRAVGTRPWSFPVAEGTFGLGFDLDLDQMWSSIGEASCEALTRAGCSPGAVAGIAVSAVRFGNVLLDAGGRALFAVPNRDARAAGESFALANEHGEAILRETGLWPMPIHASARLLWLKKQRPETLGSASHLLSVGDWVNFRLCGARLCDYSQAGCTGLFDLSRREWSWERIDSLDLPRAPFPEVRGSGERIGELSPEAALALGLAAGTPVGLGGGDTQCGLLGTGASKPGDVASVAGTTAPVQVVSSEPTIDDRGRLWSGHHVVPGLWVLESNGGPMGETLSWMARLLFPDAPDPELRLLAEAQTADVGAAGMLSTLGAEVMNARAPSMPVGQITLTHMTSADDPNPRRHLARALVEGHACAVRANLEQLAEATSQRFDILGLSGGLSRSDVFAQILADVTGATVRAAQLAETTALGAALCAGVGAGVFAAFPQAVEALVGERSSFAPGNERAEASQKLYDDWSKLREAGEGTTSPAAAAHVTPWVLQSGSAAAATSPELSSRPRVLVTASFDDASLKRLGRVMDVEYASFRDQMRLLTGPSLVEALAGYQVFVTEIDVVDADAIRQLPQLRVIGACRGDAVNVDVDACTAYGIPVLFAPGRNADAVADLTVAFIINLARRLPAASAFLEDPKVSAGNMGKMGEAFVKFQGYELWRKTVGLVGLGAVGRAVARRLSGFGTRILVSDPYVSPEQAALAGCRAVDLDTLLRESDFVSLHAAVTDETRGLIGREQIEKMKSGSYLINTARAALVDEEALLAGLESGRVAGAGLDTFAVEPPGFDHPLVKHRSVIATPHLGGNTKEVAAHQGEIISEALSLLAAGARPRCIINPLVLEDFDWSTPRREPSQKELARIQDKPGPAVSDLQRDSKSSRSRKEELGKATAPQETVAAMSAILERFCAAMAADEAVARFSEDKEVTLYFLSPDLGLDFHIAMNKGQVDAGMGPAEGGANVELRMRGEILDGMFAGTINTMECAMQGDISFTGDASKAMTIQHLQADMERLYASIREELGDPGDLAAIPQPD